VSDVRGCEGKKSQILICHSSLATHTKGHSCLEGKKSKKIGYFGILFSISLPLPSRQECVGAVSERLAN